MAGQAPALSPALHSHLSLLAQSGRALLRLDHPGTHPTGRLHLRSRARSCHPPILDHHNADPKPFVWTKSAEEILAKVTRARNALEQLASGNQALNTLH